MTELPLADASLWGLPGAIRAPDFPNTDAFTTTPIVTFLRRAAARDGMAPALASQAGHLPYGALLDMACRVARAIATRLPRYGSVATLLPSTLEGTAGMLGGLISGRVCIILNTAEPRERLAGQLQDAAPDLLLHAGTSSWTADFHHLALDTALRTEPEATDWLTEVCDPDAPMAVQFTSGSTGRPKGMAVSARAALFRVLGLVRSADLAPSDRFAPLGPLGQAGLLAPITAGATQVLCDLTTDGAGAVLRLLEREAVTATFMAPPVMRMLFALQGVRRTFRHLRFLRYGGAAMTVSDLARWRGQLPQGCVIEGGYSSSEAPLKACWVVPQDYSTTRTILPAGALQPEVDYALVGEDGGRAAPGTAAELIIRSRHVALGEWRGGRVDPTRFPASPERPGWRELKTGDLVRLGSDGLLHLLGRVDRMVKINGVRVEPAELEAVLRAEPEVTDAVVIAIRRDEETSLHGFVVGPSSTDDPAKWIASLRQRLAKRLSSPLRPRHLTILDHLPLLSNGKLDSATLTHLASEAFPTRKVAAP